MAVTSEPLGNTTGTATSLVVHCSVLTRRLRPSTSTVLVADLQVTSSVLVVIPLDPDSDVPAVPVLPAGLDVAVAVPDSRAVRTPRGELPPIGAVDPFRTGCRALPSGVGRVHAAQTDSCPKDTGMSPGELIVTVCAAPIVLSGWIGKERAVGVATGGAGVPKSALKEKAS